MAMVCRKIARPEPRGGRYATLHQLSKDHSFSKKKATSKKKPTRTVWAHCLIHSFLIAAISLKSKQIPFSTCHWNVIFLICLEMLRMCGFNQTAWHPYVFPIMAISRLMRRIVTIIMNIRKCIWKLNFLCNSGSLCIYPCLRHLADDMERKLAIWQQSVQFGKVSQWHVEHLQQLDYTRESNTWTAIVWFSFYFYIPWRSFQRARCGA